MVFKHLLVAGSTFFFAATALTAQDQSVISRGIEERTGFGLSSATPSASLQLPPGVSLEDGFSEDEAVGVALWNNVALRATLVELDLAEADLIEAGLWVNPNLQVLFGNGSKPFELLLTAPIELLWHRPKRRAAARLSMQSVAQRLVQNGLDVVHDVRQAYWTYFLSREEARLTDRIATLAEEVTELTERRLRAGDISELQVHLVRLEALSARDQAEQRELEVPSAWERLRLLTGLPVSTFISPISPTSDPVLLQGPTQSTGELLQMATSSRPDLRAAELSVEAAGQRLGWERSRTFAFVAPLLSSKGVGELGIKTGPGVTAEIPVFNRNQGKISRAEAELKQAGLHYAALRLEIESEVNRALTSTPSQKF
ncbi:TolC family protein [Acidobacteria bacterium AH-259-L09]|nr:TolC family protein [Acidobacteria bacterium AH-259-L09]